MNIIKFYNQNIEVIRKYIPTDIEQAQLDSMVFEPFYINGIRRDVSLIMEILNTDVRIITENGRIRPEKSEVERLLCDNSKITSYTNWAPKFSLRQGLLETIEWFKYNLDYYKPFINNI